MFAYRVHAHSHGDVNSAFRVRNSEWTQLAKADPQWPQAFYPTDSVIEIKDGDILIGSCTYHNDENRYVYAGTTHNDEMCNIYLMYYTDNTEDVMPTCTGNYYPQLENIIPAESEQKPPPPLSFGSSGDNSNKDAMSHHEMEGSKMHHDIPSNNRQQQPPKNSLSSLLFNNDDYYNTDDIETVEKSRSKNRNYNNKPSNNDVLGTSDLYDSGSLLDSLNADDDYSALSDSDQSLLLAAAVAQLTGNKKLNLNNNNDNNRLNKIKSQLNNLQSQSVSSEFSQKKNSSMFQTSKNVVLLCC
jgi:hypothetical protein